MLIIGKAATILLDVYFGIVQMFLALRKEYRT